MTESSEEKARVAFNGSELELLIDALALLEDKPIIPEDQFLGFAVGTSVEDAQAVADKRISEAKAEIKAKRRRIAILKAKLIEEDERLYNRMVVKANLDS